MALFEGHRTVVVEHPDDVAEAPDEGLEVAGWTLLPAFFVRLTRDPGRDLDQLMGWLPDDETYTGSLWPGSPVRAVAPEVAGSLPLELAKDAGVQVGAVRFFPIWIDDRHLLVVSPLTIRTRSDFDIPHLTAGTSGFDDVLRTIRSLRSTAAQQYLTRAVATWLTGKLGPGGVERVSPLEDALGMELWDLRGSDRDDDEPYSGVDESRRFAWQIAALKGHGVRHILHHGRWREQRREQVANEVHHGYTYLDDHLAVVNGTSCLEIVHDLGPHLVPSVLDRLQRWGFNSSALFVWCVEVLRGCIARDLVVDYDARLLDLQRRTGMSAAAHAALVRDVISDSGTADSLATMPRRWREERHRALQAEIAALRGHDMDVDRLRLALDRTGGLARDLRAVEAQSRTTRASILLAAFAAALAAVGLPQLVDVIADFRETGATTELWISVVLVVTVLGAAVSLAVLEMRTSRTGSD